MNVASECGFTPQYKGLQEIYLKYKDQGFEIIGFPCNQFGGQEPGDNTVIEGFCSRNFGVTFQIMDKVDVNGDKAHEFFKFLKEEKSGMFGSSIKWNFEKFLITRNGTVYAHYLSVTTPAGLCKDIEKLLAEPVVADAATEASAVAKEEPVQ